MDMIKLKKIIDPEITFMFLILILILLLNFKNHSKVRIIKANLLVVISPIKWTKFTLTKVNTIRTINIFFNILI